MKIILNTDRHIPGHARIEALVTAAIESEIGRFGGQITRVEVHLGDENAKKSGPDDKRCTLEVRLEGRAPVAVTHHAENVDLAVEGAAEKMARLLDRTLDRLRDTQRIKADPLPPEPEVND